MRNAALVLSLLSVVHVAACSSGDPPAASDAADSGLPGDAADAADGAADAADGAIDTASPPGDGGKTLESMSAEDATKLCRDVLGEAGKKLTEEQMKRAMCALVGGFSAMGAATDAEARAKCQTAYDDCLAKPLEDAGPAKDSCAGFAGKAATCKGLTEAEYRAYVDEQTGFLLKLADPKVCSTVSASGGTAAPSPATEVVQTKCPALVSSGG